MHRVKIVRKKEVRQHVQGNLEESCDPLTKAIRLETLTLCKLNMAGNLGWDCGEKQQGK